MEAVVSHIIDKMFGSECLGAEMAPYVKTAGTVVLGWIIVSWIWHIVLMLFAPAVVSVLAIILICPTTLGWLLNQLNPALRQALCIILEKIGLAPNLNLKFD